MYLMLMYIKFNIDINFTEIGNSSMINIRCDDGLHLQTLLLAPEKKETAMLLGEKRKNVSLVGQFDKPNPSFRMEK